MMLIGSVGYAATAVAFGLLAVLMLTSWRGRLQGGLLVAAAALSAAWAAAAAFDFDTPSHWQLVGTLEVLRNTAWLAFLARLTPAGQGVSGLPRHFASLAPAAFVLVYGLIGVLAPANVEIIPQVIRTLVTTGLVTAIAGLVLLEQLYRALRLEPRKTVLPLILGLGGLLAYDLFLYSHGLLFKGIHTELWAARGFANLLAVPLLLLAARRNPAWSVDVFVSRHVAFYTTSIMAIGVYLVVMAVAGYGLRIAGGEWGTIVQVVFLFGAVVLLAWIIFSPAARARLKVFIAKHFYSNKYDYRQEWLRLTRRLAESDATEPLPQRGLGAMVDLAGAAGGALWVSDAARETEGYHRVASLGTLADTAADTLPTDDPLIGFLAERRWTVNVADALRNPDSHPGLAVPAWLERLGQNTLVVPLLNQDRLWGVVALAAPKSIGRLSYEDIDLFRVAGMQIAAVLAQAEADRLLSESRQFEAYNRFAAFIMHDLKNVIAQQSLVVRNAARYRDDPAFIDDALDTVANSVERMQRLLEQVRRGRGGTQVERVDVARLFDETVRYHTDREPLPTALCADSLLRLRIDRERLAAVLGHLVTNAQDATPASGSVRVEATLEDGWLVLAVEDDGSGMDEAFIRERLFKPFDSTKGSKGMGIGAYQARQFVESAGGEVRIRSAPGQGTRFEMRFPATLVEFAVPGDDAQRADQDMLEHDTKSKGDGTGG
ncbi:MAG TPA: XrtA/PEP-CTERM system histidine kinase PrsK [Gammaproteobacteria bacterium]|nr:XrtA/PEP-CTERM system histidine kinase PrsK [Gammaproteobacteria bacterium]